MRSAGSVGGRHVTLLTSAVSMEAAWSASLLMVVLSTALNVANAAEARTDGIPVRRPLIWVL